MPTSNSFKPKRLFTMLVLLATLSAPLAVYAQMIQTKMIAPQNRNLRPVGGMKIMNPGPAMAAPKMLKARPFKPVAPRPNPTFNKVNKVIPFQPFGNIGPKPIFPAKKVIPFNPKPKSPFVVDKFLPVKPKPKAPLVINKMLPIKQKPKAPLVVDKFLPIKPKPNGPLVIDKMLPIKQKPKAPLVVDKFLPIKPKPNGPLVIDKMLPIKPIKPPLGPLPPLKPIPPFKPIPGGGGGNPAPNPAPPHPPHPPHGCHWDFHFCLPHFHDHCWNPTHHCYNIWIFRSGIWVYETIYSLEALSREVALVDIALTEPIPYEYVQKLEDGTFVERLGTWWRAADGQPYGREEWRMVNLGPDLLAMLTESGHLLKTPAGFVGANQPTENESVDTQRDGTVMERRGTFLADPNGEPRGDDQWVIASLGPVVEVLLDNRAAPYFD